MICFGCGDEYDPNARTVVIELASMPDNPEQERPIVDVKSIRFGKTLKLCPACTRACAIGIAITSDNLSLTEEVEFEEDEHDADLSEDKPEDETV